jgi:hypothetical protein
MLLTAEQIEQAKQQLETKPPAADLTFYDRAVPMVERGWSVIRLGEKSKIASDAKWQELATTDLDQVDKWDTESMRANCGLVATPDGNWALDFDDLSVISQIEKETGQKMPTTFVVQSSPNKAHYHFKQNDASRTLGNSDKRSDDGKELYSARISSRYVLSPFSNHPQTETPYQILSDAPIVEAPQWLTDWLTAQKNVDRKKVASADTNAPVVEGGRNNFLASQGGKLRNMHMLADQIERNLLEINELRCNPPLPESEVRIIAASVSRYAPGGTEFNLTIGGKPVELSRPTNVSATAAPTEVVDPETCFKSVGELPDGGIDWVIQNIMPEGLNFLGALSGHGKTFFGLSLAKALTTGKPFLGKYAVPTVTPVMYLVPESSGRAFKARCLRFGIPNDRKLFICRTISEGPVLSLNSPEVLAMVQKLKPVVFVDTAVRFSTASDENSSREQQQLWNEMMAMRLAGARGVMALHHSPKSSQNEEMTLENVLRGSGDIGAQADAVWGIRRDNTLFDNGAGQGEIDVACVKPRDFTPPAPFRLAMSYVDSHGVVVSYFDTTGDFKVLQEATQQKDIAERFVKFIKEYPQASMKEVSDELNVKVCQIRKLAKEQKYHKPKGADWMRSAPSGFEGAMTTEKGGPDADVNLDARGEKK